MIIIANSAVELVEDFQWQGKITKNRAWHLKKMGNIPRIENDCSYFDYFYTVYIDKDD